MRRDAKEFQEPLLASPDELIHELAQAVSALATGISTLENEPDVSERVRKAIRVFRLTEIKLRDVVERLRIEAKERESGPASSMDSNPEPDPGQDECRGAQ